MAQRTRPTSATLIAVLNLLIGIPCICCSGAMAGMTLFGLAADKAQPAAAVPVEPKIDPKQDPFGAVMEQVKIQQAFMQKEVPSINTVQLILESIVVMYSFMLLVAGVLMLMNRPAGRLLGLLGVVLMGLTTLASVGYRGAVVYPAMAKWDEKEQARLKAKNQPTPPIGGSQSMLIGLGFGALINLGYSCLAFFVLMSAPVREFYSGTPKSDLESGDDEPEDYRDPRPPDFDDR